MKKDCRPCMECLPFRWIDRQSLVELLQTEIPATLHSLQSIAEDDKDFFSKNEGKTNHLTDLLFIARIARSEELSEQIADFVKTHALSASKDYELQRNAVLSLANSSKPEHGQLLGEVLGSSVTPDIKLSAILSLRYIGNEQADKSLQNTESTEP